MIHLTTEKTEDYTELIRDYQIRCLRFLCVILCVFGGFSQFACTSSEARLAEARSLMRQGKFREALTPLNQAVEADNQNAQAFVARGVAYFELKEYANALLDYEQAQKLQPDFYQPYYNRALLKTAQGDTDGAIKDYSEAIRFAPDTSRSVAADIYLNRGQLFAGTGNLTSALTDFQKAIELNPQNALAYFNRGSIHFQQDEYPVALTDFAKAVQLDPKFGKAFHALGVTQVMTGQREAACLSLKQSQKLGYADAAASLQQYCE